MSQKLQFQNHVKNPAAQPFNVDARKNKTKQRSWWNALSPTFWRNAKKTKPEPAKAVE